MKTSTCVLWEQQVERVSRPRLLPGEGALGSCGGGKEGAQRYYPSLNPARCCHPWEGCELQRPSEGPGAALSWEARPGRLFRLWRPVP